MVCRVAPGTAEGTGRYRNCEWLGNCQCRKMRDVARSENVNTGNYKEVKSNVSWTAQNGTQVGWGAAVGSGGR